MQGCGGQRERSESWQLPPRVHGQGRAECREPDVGNAALQGLPGERKSLTVEFASVALPSSMKSSPCTWLPLGCPRASCPGRGEAETRGGRGDAGARGAAFQPPPRLLLQPRVRVASSAPGSVPGCPCQGSVCWGAPGIGHSDRPRGGKSLPTERKIHSGLQISQPLAREAVLAGGMRRLWV